MAGPSIVSSEINFSDVQGLVRFGFGKLKGARYALAKIKNLEAARSWLQHAPITSAVAVNPPPSTALQVAFTVEGLRKLGVSESVIKSFSHEFVSGMTESNRSRRLGDVKDNAPSEWWWGGPGNEPHLVVMFFSESELLDDFVQSSTGEKWNNAFEVHWLYTSDLDGIEPFGFADGISQPKIDWEQRRVSVSSFPIWKFHSPFGYQADYSNIVALGEFLLGYRNEYGKYTDRPLVDADASSTELLPAEDAPEKRDVGRNGTYLVMRQLHQDVTGFWRFLGEHSGGDVAQAEKLAAAMVGRTKEGDPLAPIQRQPIPGVGPDPEEIRLNQFTYDGDPRGVRCPFGAHIRRANPRNTDFPVRPTGLFSKIRIMLGFGPKRFRDDLMSSVRYHRILRRGREYGPCIPPAKALASDTPGESESGLHFLCLNANILRQFEFLQHAWMTSTKFSGLTGESDPLLGNRVGIPGCPITSDFNIPKDSGLRDRVSDLRQFVKVRGGAYFFLPSLRALRYFLRVPNS
jgi:deferrochelatase/peroxidase EfeB